MSPALHWRWICTGLVVLTVCTIAIMGMSRVIYIPPPACPAGQQYLSGSIDNNSVAISGCYPDGYRPQ